MKKKVVSVFIALAMLFSLAVPAMADVPGQSFTEANGLKFMRTPVFTEPGNMDVYHYELWVVGLADNNQNATSIVIPERIYNGEASDGTYVVGIADNAFYMLPIMDVTIEGHLSFIGKNAFAMCGMLRNITFEKIGCPEIRDNAFGGSTDLWPGGTNAYVPHGAIGTASWQYNPDIYPFYSHVTLVEMPA